MSAETTVTFREQVISSVREMNLWVIAHVIPEGLRHRRIQDPDISTTTGKGLGEAYDSLITESVKDFNEFMTAIVSPDRINHCTFPEVAQTLNRKPEETDNQYDSRIAEYKNRFYQLFKERHNIQDSSQDFFDLLEMESISQGLELCNLIRSRVAEVLTVPLELEKQELLNRIKKYIQSDTITKEQKLQIIKIAISPRNMTNLLRAKFKTYTFPEEISKIISSTDMQQEVKSLSTLWSVFLRMFDEKYSPKQRIEAWSVFVAADSAVTIQIDKHAARGTLELVDNILADHYWYYKEYIDELNHDEFIILHDKNGKVLEVSRDLNIEAREGCYLRSYELPTRYIKFAGRTLPVKNLGRGKTLLSANEKAGTKDGKHADDWNGKMLICKTKEDVVAVWQHFIDALIRGGCTNISLSARSGLTQTLFPQGVRLNGDIDYDPETKKYFRKEILLDYTGKPQNGYSNPERQTIQDDIEFTDKNGVRRKVELQVYVEEDYFDKLFWEKISDVVYKSSKLHKILSEHPVPLIQKVLSTWYEKWIKTEVLKWEESNQTSIHSPSVAIALRAAAKRKITQ